MTLTARPTLSKLVWFFLVFAASDLTKKSNDKKTSTMSSKLDAPQQFKQPSRKGKKAWRKNVDVTEVQEGLRQFKEEEIKGYVPVYLAPTDEDILTLYKWPSV